MRSRATIGVWITAALLGACGAERYELRTGGGEDNQKRRGQADATATSLLWQMSCEPTPPQSDEELHNVVGLGGFAVPDDGPRKLSVTFAGTRCASPVPKRGRDVVLAFELSDAMAELDPIGADGSCQRSRLLREWAAVDEAVGFDVLDGDVRVSVILYSKIVLAKVAGFHQKFESVVERLLATQKKADLDSMICLGRGTVDLATTAPQIELLKANFGRSDATKELVVIGAAQHSGSADLPGPLAELKANGWLVSGINFDHAEGGWGGSVLDGLGESTWSTIGDDVSKFSIALAKSLKNRLGWQFAARPMRRPDAQWSTETLRLSPDQLWTSPVNPIEDDGENWGLEAQLQAVDRFGIASQVWSAFITW